MAMTYLRLVPVASRKAAGVSGSRAARSRAGRDEVVVGRAGVGEIRFEDDDPTLPLEGADTIGRAPGRACRRRQRRRCRDREGGLESIHRGDEGRIRPVVGRESGRRTTSPSRTRSAVADRRGDDVGRGCGRIGRRQRDEPSEARGGRRPDRHQRRGATGPVHGVGRGRDAGGQDVRGQVDAVGARQRAVQVQAGSRPIRG